MNRHANCPAWRSHLTTDEQIAHLGKGLVIPERWDKLTFARHGRALMMTIHRMARLAQSKAVPHVATGCARALNAQVDAVIAIVESKRPKMVFTVEADHALWMQAIEDVLGKPSGLATEIMPAVQSVMGQAYSKVSTMLAQTPNPDVNPIIVRQAQDIAAKITQITETTRKRIIGVVEDAMEGGATVAETVSVLKERLPDINHTRALCIARTELSGAWSRGSAEAYLESETLTHLSVIGCTSREEDRWGQPSYVWLFHGESTCNYEDLSITELTAFLEVGFHPQHQGTIIPSGFR